MPKVNGSGSRAKKFKKASAIPINEHLPKKEIGEPQMYAAVTRLLGNGRVMARCEDSTERMAIIPGKFRWGANKGKQWVDQGSIVLVSIRDFQTDKVDVLYVYNHDEAKRMRKEGELKSLPLNDKGDGSEKSEDDEIDFNEDEEINLEDL